jgi:hypothetical protein
MDEVFRVLGLILGVWAAALRFFPTSTGYFMRVELFFMRAFL